MFKRLKIEFNLVLNAIYADTEVNKSPARWDISWETCNMEAKHAPIEDLITGPDTDMGKAIANKPDEWEEVFRTSDTIVRIYRYRGSGAPPRWQTKRRPM